jgi:uncharacterized protein YacL
MFVHIFWRLLVFCLGALLGWQLGIVVASWIPAMAHLGKGYYLLITALVGGLLGYLTAPYVTVFPYQALRRKLCKVSVRGLLMGVVGAFVGLVIGALLALPLSMLPGLWGQISPLTVALLLGFLGALTMIMRERDILGFVGVVVGHDGLRRRHDITLLDTSVIIDGRVADICAAGFIRGTLLVPRFVLDELQHIADSPDVLRRNRGRRGLDILNKMQKDDRVPLDISDVDAPDIREVDGKLVKLAQELDCPVLTNDYNLNRVAEIQGVQVLNINELANAVKAVVLPGETLRTRIIQEGKEHGQGVGYLDDGTMIVVEDGRRFMDAEVTIVVTRVLQTVAGRMIFGQMQEVKHRGTN